MDSSTLEALEAIESWWRLPNKKRTIEAIEPAMRLVLALLTSEPEPCEDARAVFRKINGYGCDDEDEGTALIESYASRRLQEMQAEIERLREALNTFGHHLSDCRYPCSPGQFCSCGYDEALSTHPDKGATP